MKKLNLLFQFSTITSLLVAGFVTFAMAQSTDQKAQSQKLTIDIEVTENGETKRIQKEIDMLDGEGIKAILDDLDVLEDIDIRGTGERLEVKVLKKRDGSSEKDIDVRVFGDDDFEWFGHEFEKEKGPLLGVFIESYNENGSRGALVKDIIEGSAAEKAQLQENDVITAINDKGITSEKQLREVIGSYKVGDEVEVKFVRDGKQMSKTVELGASIGHRIFMEDFEFDFDGEELKEQLKKLERLEEFDFDFDIDVDFDDNRPFLGVKPGSDVERGVQIGEVIKESSAEKMGLEAGDVVTKMDGIEVNSFDELAKVIRERKAGESVEIEYLRNGNANKTIGELGTRENHHVVKRIFRSAPDMWRDEEIVKEVSVVIELKDCTKEEEEMLEEPAAVDFNKSLPLNKIEFAPNPSDGLFNLAFDLPKKQDTRVMIFDQAGRKVFEELLVNFSGSYKNQIDISAQPSGVYFLIIAQQDKQFSRKIVKN